MWPYSWHGCRIPGKLLPDLGPAPPCSVCVYVGADWRGPSISYPQPCSQGDSLIRNVTGQGQIWRAASPVASQAWPALSPCCDTDAATVNHACLTTTLPSPLSHPNLSRLPPYRFRRNYSNALPVSAGTRTTQAAKNNNGASPGVTARPANPSARPQRLKI